MSAVRGTVEILQRIYASIDETRNLVQDIRIGKANFLMMAYYLQEFKHFLEELSGRKDIASITFSEFPLQRLANVVESISKLARRCRNSCRIILLFQSTDLVSEMKNRFLELSECLDSMFQGYSSISSDVEEQIFCAISKLNGAMFYVEPVHENISKVLHQSLATAQVDKEFATNILNQVSRQLNINFSEARELILELSNSLEIARVEGRDSDASVLQKLQSILAPAVISEIENSFDQTSNALSQDGIAIPKSFFCPITHQIMDDPVMLAEAGHTYERSGILKWFKEGKKTCPVSSRPLETCELVPNLKLKQNIEEFFDLKRYKTMLNAIRHIESNRDMGSDKAVNTIKSLLDIHPKYKHLLVTLDGIRPLVSILKPTENLREKIYWILFGIASLAVGYKTLIIEAGAVPILVRLLQKNPAANGGPVQLLWELSKCECGRKAILEEKASVFIVASAVNLCACDHKVQAQQLMYNLCEQDTSVIAQAAASDIFEPLICKLSSGDKALQLEMLETISNLNINRQSMHKLVNAGVIPPLLHILHHGAFNSKLSAAKALKHLSSVDDNKVPITEAGTLHILVKLLSSRDPVLALRILEILLNLATEKISAWHIEREVTVLPCLVTFLSSGNSMLHETALKILECMAKDSHTVRQFLVEWKVGSTIYNFLKNGNLSHSCRLSIVNIISYLSEDNDTRRVVTNFSKMLNYFLDILKEHRTSLDEVEAILVILAAMVKTNEAKAALLAESNLHQTYINFLKSDRQKVQECAVLILSKMTNPKSNDYSNTWEFVLLETKALLNLAKMGVIPCLIDLLRRGSERAKRHAAQTLRNLSIQTHQLSERPTLLKKLLAKIGISKFKICEVHAGKCSSKGTLCLVESGAVSDLIHLIKDDQYRTSQCAIEALSTLIKNNNNEIGLKGVDYLVERGIIKHLVQVVGYDEALTEKALMVLERIFKCRKYRAPKYAKLAKEALYTNMAIGNPNVRTLAVESLMHLKMVPQTSTYTKTN